LPREPICVIGLWHLGCVVAASWAELGHRVVGTDPSAPVVEALRGGKPPIFEPGLEDLVRKNLQAGTLSFAGDVGTAARGARFAFIAFDTPVDDDDRSDLAPLERALDALAPVLERGAIVVVSSQVPVGTCRRWRERLRQGSPHGEVDLVYSPENLRLGEAIACYLHPDRIVVGADAAATAARVTELFAPMAAPVLPMSLPSAEMAKHALNGFLATSVSFINEIATLCETSGADVLAVAEALRTDPRVGRRAFLSPGFGFAGGTLARDVQVLKETGRAAGAATPLLDGVLEVNRRRSGLVLRRLSDVLDGVAGRTIGVLGLTYKAGTSTLRRSVALEVIASLAGAGARVQAFDPAADLAELDGRAKFEMAPDAYAAARGAMALVVLTEWPEFRALDFERVRGLMAQPVILDGKNLLADLDLAARGFRYLGVGR
jgi:UDPglucose 6-dehydrogenase